MNSLAAILLASSITISGFAAAPLLGPQPHERTDTPKKKNAHIGRYLYVGTAPKFDGSEIELTISKMSLTVRATGWVSQSKMDAYASQLYKRWEQIDTTLQDPNFQLHPLVNLMSLPTKDTSIAWASIAGQYSSHVLENRGVEVYNAKRNVRALEEAGNEDQYRSNISTAILRYFFNDNSLTVEAVKNDNRLRDRLLSPLSSAKLFKTHHGARFISSSSKAGFVGYLTMVYPIAATVAGPFDQPAEGIRTLMSYGTIEARWWSDKWDDEFGGLPFILVEPSGVAFHGPITNFAPLDVWYLRRGYVSHGCHRMDTSDIIELRNILPRTVKELGKVKLTILNNFDVTDWDGDGKQEVVDVKYYNIPTAIAIPKGKTLDDAIKPFLIENQMKSYYTSHAYAKKMYDPATDTVKGTPKYKVVSGKLIKDGVHEALPLARFDYQPSRVLQYKELNTQMYPYDDNQGKYPPTYFLKN
jgi:hypothetical protein